MNSPWPVLRFLNEQQVILKSGEKLPHWQQENSTYFVTYRLNDSIPADILLKWKAEKTQWLEEHPKPWSEIVEKEYHQLISMKVDRYLDEGHGSCVLSNSENAEILKESFHYFDHKRYLLHCFVMMPNHVHLLFSVHDETNLAEIISTWKRFTATRINRRCGNQDALWQRDYFDRMIRNWDHFMAVARYIRRNPIKAKLPQGHFHLYTAPWVEKLLN